MNNVIENRIQTVAIPQVAEHRSGTRASAADFLQKLANDDAFRDQLVRAPLATILAEGFDIDASDLPAEGVKLPSKPAIQAYLKMMDVRFNETNEIVRVFRI